MLLANRPSHRWQFSLKQLLAINTLTCALLAMGGIVGPLIACLALGLLLIGWATSTVGLEHPFGGGLLAWGASVAYGSTCLAAASDLSLWHLVAASCLYPPLGYAVGYVSALANQLTDR